jgi:hypothetical protein
VCGATNERGFTFIETFRDRGSRFVPNESCFVLVSCRCSAIIWPQLGRIIGASMVVRIGHLKHTSGPRPLILEYRQCGDGLFETNWKLSGLQGRWARKVHAMTQHERKMIEQAKLYALADNSDPFAYRRARTHLMNGVACYANANGEEAYYSAEPYLETRRLPDLPNGKPGEEYQATVYRNRFRP